MPRQTRPADASVPPQHAQSGSAPPTGGRAPKRRKIRKGTHSCWACKRKKIRCTFSDADGQPIDLDTLDSPSEALAGVVCDGCRRRGTPCVSQELPETAALSAAANHSRLVDDRLGRMEALVEMLVKNATQAGTGASSSSTAAAAAATEPQLALPDFSALIKNRWPPANDVGPRVDGDKDEDGDGNDERDDSDTDLGPDNLQESRAAPAELHSHSRHAQTQPTTYTNWFGHERGIGEEEQPGTLPPPATTSPATPASTPSARGLGAAVNSQAGSASTACTESSPADNANDDGPAGNAPYYSTARMQQEYMNRYKTLAGCWPSSHDLDVILEALERPVRSGLHKVLVFTPFSAVTAAESPPVSLESARALLVLPPVGAHLVLVAQKLLYLASFLQHMHPKFDPDLKRLRMPHRELIQRIMCATTTVVTGNDSLIGSFEGVQCLVMQGIIQSNQGNLRRAWLAFRRAMTMTQLMGLHRGFPGSSLTVLDPTTPPPIMPKCMWFRILYADRYLSLMLGLPQGLPGDSHVMCPGMKQKNADFAKPSPPSDLDGSVAGFDFAEAWNELRKIEQSHAVIAGRIIERNEAWRIEEEDTMTGRAGDDDDDNSSSDSMDNDLANPSSTQSIDMALQRASRSMPAQWWLTPFISDCSVSEGDGATNFMRTQQLIDQLFHYHLLTQLHLPYMLRRGSGRVKRNHLVRGADEYTAASPDAADMLGSAGSVDKYAYSKITCVSASREVLSRFLSLRSCKQVTFFSRCIDFFALLASMTLCLAHLDSHRNEQLLLQRLPQNMDKKNCMAANDFLAHQRLSDRGMMERVLQSMDEMAKINEEDPLSAKSAAFLRRMLDVEHDASLAVAASMGCAEARREIAQREADARASKASSNSGDLRVWVPFLGTIRINKEGILRVKGNECSLVLPTAAQAGPDVECRVETDDTHGAGAQPSSHAARAAVGAEKQLSSNVDSNGIPSTSSAVPRHLGSATVTYPSLTSGGTSTVNSLSGIGVQLPTWSSGDTIIPNNSPGVDNPYMFYTPGNLPGDGGALGVNNGGDGGSINAAAFGGFGNYGSDGYGNGSGGGYGNGSYRGVGQGDDWTLQGVDFAFFENLLMHGGLGDAGAGGAGDAGATSAPAQEPQLETAGEGSRRNSNSNSDTGNKHAPRPAPDSNKITMDDNGPIPVRPSDGGGPEDDIILTNSRRPGKLGEHMLWM